MLFDDMKMYEKAEKHFLEDWPQKREILMNTYKDIQKNLMENELETMFYHTSHKEHACPSDCSSVSSTDPRDIEILISGEHPHFFDAKNCLKKLFSQDKVRREDEKSCFFNCKKRIKDWLLKEKKEFEDDEEKD